MPETLLPRPDPESEGSNEPENQREIEELLREYDDIVQAVASEYNDPQNYEDLLVVCREKLFTAMSKLQAEGTLHEKGKGYFVITLRNACNDYYKRQSRQSATAFSQLDTDQRSFVDRLPDQKSGGEDEILDQLENETLLNMIWEALGKLPDKQREIMACALQGYTQEETAQKLGINIGTVKSNQSRTVQKLRRMLAHRYEPDN